MLIKLTIQKTGEAIIINPEEIGSVEANKFGEGSMIRKLDGQFKFVSESVEEIFNMTQGNFGPRLSSED